MNKDPLRRIISLVLKTAAVCFVVAMLLAQNMQTLAQVEQPPEQAYISGVKGLRQSLSLSCESRSAADWAAYWGVKIGEKKFLNGLPRSDNPDVSFVGDPNGVWGNIPPYSYGVHAEPVAALLREYGLRAEAHKGLGWDDLRQEIAAGRPAIVWVVGQMWPGTPVHYTAADGHSTKVASFEHTMILIGYDARRVWMMDAYSGMEQAYPLNVFLKSWATLGNMAVTGSGLAQAAESEAPVRPDTYTLQEGEQLVEVARRFEMSWQELAAYNRLDFPYRVVKDQVLYLHPPAASQDSSEGEIVVETPSGTEFQWVFYGPLMERKVYLSVVFNSPAIETEQKLTFETESEQAALTPVPSPRTYQVQQGDYLRGLAEQFGLDWMDLAAQNGIQFPYTIYPGQVLVLED